MPAVFITQQMLQAWADQGKVSVEENTLHLLKEKRSVELFPAVRVTEVIGGDADTNNLLGKVKRIAHLKEQGGEHYADSLILGDIAYQVVEGFLGDLTGGVPGSSPQGTAPGPATSRVTPAPLAPVLVSVAPVSVAPVAAETAAPPQTSPDARPDAEPASGEGESEAERLSKIFLDTVG